MLDCQELWDGARVARPTDVHLYATFDQATPPLSDQTLVPLYAAPDLVYLRGPDAPEVITDLKTGSANAVVETAHRCGRAAFRALAGRPR